MPRLVHLNGPPGIGKSTLARMYVDNHLLAFCLDIDGFRRLIGGWDQRPEASGELARRMALAMTREHLSSGYDVVIPQFVARPEFVRQLSDVAREAAASFDEVVLLDEPERARRRFEARAADPTWSAHHEEAVRQIDGAGGFVAMYDRLMQIIDGLPDPIKIMTTAGEVNAAYRSLVVALQSGGKHPD